MWSSFLLLQALESRSKKHWLYFGAAAAAAFYTHYYLLFSIVAQGLYALYVIYKNREWKNPLKDNALVNLFMAGGFAAVLYLPWLPSLLEQLSRVQGGYWIPPMDRWSVPSTIWKITMGGQGVGHNLLIVGVIVALLMLWYFIRKIKDKEKWLVVLGLVIPFLAAVLLSLRSDIYLDRYFVFASLFMSIMAAGALYSIPNMNYRRVAIILFAFLSIYYFGQNWKMLDVKDFGGVVKKPGMSAAAAYLNDSAGPNDRIYVGSSLIFFTFKYYNETGLQPKLISGSPLKDIPHFAGTAIMTEDDLILNGQLFDPTIHERNDIIWLVWTTGWGGTKPNVPWTPIYQESWPDTPGFKGEVFVTQYRVE
jgi:hypothetical protein